MSTRDPHLVDQAQRERPATSEQPRDAAGKSSEDAAVAGVCHDTSPRFDRGGSESLANLADAENATVPDPEGVAERATGAAARARRRLADAADE